MSETNVRRSNGILHITNKKMKPDWIQKRAKSKIPCTATTVRKDR